MIEGVAHCQWCAVPTLLGSLVLALAGNEESAPPPLTFLYLQQGHNETIVMGLLHLSQVPRDLESLRRLAPRRQGAHLDCL
ncbi:hypothetical protein GW17_00052266 [Ensete ventricosum]|nr:hypothetical protein GW17_00052266 [Ensete ventricosum]